MNLSIIVPIYNVEEYIAECIDSILAQTYKDWELILVDDGSTDNSGKICDEYALKDNRIKVIHKENGGLSSARNAGIDNISGNLITFIDSDDVIIGKDTLQKLIDELTDDKELDSFLFSLGCYSGEAITVVTRRKHGCVVSIKDGRYSIDNALADAIEVE